MSSMLRLSPASSRWCLLVLLVGAILVTSCGTDENSCTPGGSHYPECLEEA